MRTLLGGALLYLFLKALMFATNVVKHSATLMFIFADDSMNLHPIGTPAKT